MDQIKFVHAFLGYLVAVTGLLQIILRKGGRLHAALGNTYFWAWGGIVVTGGILGSPIITMFALLGWYMAYFGYRFGKQKRVETTLLDKTVVVLGMLMGAGSLAWGAWMLSVDKNDFGVVALFFGAIFLLNAVQDYRRFITKKLVKKLSGHKLEWLFEHFGRMYVSYIAAMTAFAVIQDVFGQTMLNWLLPTGIGTALLILSGKFYRKKYGLE